MSLVAVLLLLISASVASAVGAAPQSVTLDGELMNAAMTAPVLDSSALFKIQILNPAKTCVLYEESQTVNTSNGGNFNIQVGSATGSGRRTSNDSNNTMAQVYQNSIPISGASCTYSPATGDVRYFRMIVTPSASGVAETLAPDTLFDSVPNATVAETVDGVGKDALVQVGGNSVTAAMNIGANANYGLNFLTNSTSRMTILAGGSVGIGTSAPNSLLHVSGSTGYGTTVYSTAENRNTAGKAAVSARSDAVGLDLVASGSTSDTNSLPYILATAQFPIPLAFVINNTERMRIDATTGGLAIATTTAKSLLDVKGGASVGTYAGTTAAPSNGLIVSGQVGIGSAAPNYPLDVIGDISTSTCIRTSAGVTGGVCSSDIRLKSHVRNFETGLTALLGFSPKLFTYNGLGEHPATRVPELGLIAQDVEKTAPELISKKLVKLHSDDRDATEIELVNYSSLPYILVNSVKEIYAKFLALNDRLSLLAQRNDSDVAKLKAANDRLEQRLAEQAARMTELEKRLGEQYDRRKPSSN